jgi:hypothetical protein
MLLALVATGAALSACAGRQYFAYANRGSQLVYIENLAGCLIALAPGASAVVDSDNEPYQDEYWSIYDSHGGVIDRPGNTCADQAACAQGTVIHTHVPGVAITLTDQAPGALAPCVPWPFAGTMPPVQPTPSSPGA